MCIISTGLRKWNNFDNPLFYVVIRLLNVDKYSSQQIERNWNLKFDFLNKTANFKHRIMSGCVRSWLSFSSYPSGILAVFVCLEPLPLPLQLFTLTMLIRYAISLYPSLIYLVTANFSNMFLIMSRNFKLFFLILSKIVLFIFISLKTFSMPEWSVFGIHTKLLWYHISIASNFNFIGDEIFHYSLL